MFILFREQESLNGAGSNPATIPFSTLTIPFSTSTIPFSTYRYRYFKNTLKKIFSKNSIFSCLNTVFKLYFI